MARVLYVAAVGLLLSGVAGPAWAGEDGSDALPCNSLCRAWLSFGTAEDAPKRVPEAPAARTVNAPAVEQLSAPVAKLEIIDATPTRVRTIAGPAKSVAAQEPRKRVARSAPVLPAAPPPRPAFAMDRKPAAVAAAVKAAPPTAAVPRAIAPAPRPPEAVVATAEIARPQVVLVTPIVVEPPPPAPVVVPAQPPLAVVIPQASPQKPAPIVEAVPQASQAAPQGPAVAPVIAAVAPPPVAIARTELPITPAPLPPPSPAEPVAGSPPADGGVGRAQRATSADAHAAFGPPPFDVIGALILSTPRAVPPSSPPKVVAAP